MRGLSREVSGSDEAAIGAKVMIKDDSSKLTSILRMEWGLLMTIFWLPHRCPSALPAAITKLRIEAMLTFDVVHPDPVCDGDEVLRKRLSPLKTDLSSMKLTHIALFRVSS